MGKELFRENCFSVLAVYVNDDEQKISRRAHELEMRIEIDDIPSYRGDFWSAKKIRSKKTLKNAVGAISNADKRLRDTFFWFFIQDDIDGKAIRACLDGEFEEGFELWRGKIASHSHSWIAKRNLAIAESIYIERKHGKSVAESAKYWKEILESDKQWTEFEKLYNLYNEHVSHANFEKLREKAGAILSDYYAEIAIEAEDYKIIARFNDIVGIQGDVFSDKILKPLLEKYVSLSARIDAFEVESFFRESERRKVSRALNGFVGEANELIGSANSLGQKCWSSSVVAVRREKLAKEARGLANLICNGIFDRLTALDKDADIPTWRRGATYAEKFYEIAKKFAYSEKLKAQIAEDSDMSAMETVLKKRGEFEKERPYLEAKHEIVTTLDRWKYMPSFKYNYVEVDRMIDLIDKVLSMETDSSEVEALRGLRSKLISWASPEKRATYRSTASESDDPLGSVLGVVVFFVAIILFIIWACS